MMSSKPRKLIKTMRSGSPMRKHILKKAARASSPLRNSGSSRPSTMKKLSPGIKRSHVMPSTSKTLHSSRLRSIASSSSPHRSVARHSIPSPEVSMDRSRSFKRSKYEKRKMQSISPVRHPSSSPTSHAHQDSPPYHGERYLGSRSPEREDHLEPPPAKKKMRREPDRFLSNTSLRKSSEIPFISDSGSSLRSEVAPSHSATVPMMSHNYLDDSVSGERVERSFHSHSRSRHSPPPVSNNPSKRPPPTLKNSYDSAGGERYKAGSSVSLFPPSEKSYAPTLNERFSSVEASRTEPRIRYSREDLEKITIDIRRSLRDCSPTLRQMTSPSDVKLVRRTEEGHGPVFDREIKKAPRDMREDAYYEKKASGDNIYQSSHSMDLRQVENYEITRHRFDTHHASFHSSSGRSLSDRWQNSDGRKDSAPLDRDEREYERVPPKKGFVEIRNRSKSGDRDFRSERYTVGESIRSRSDYHESQRRSVPIPLDPRGEIIPHKEISPLEMRRRLDMKRSGGERKSSPPIRSGSRNHFHPPTEKRYSESFSREKHHNDHRPPPMESHKWSGQKGRPDIRGEKFSEYSRRPDKYNYKSWPDRRESTPSSSSYFEHSGREGMESYRGRGNSRPFRASRGFRTRGFRGTPRGSFRSRGTLGGGYRGSGSPRGRGAPRRGRYSPHLWEHDMYASLSPDRK